MGDATRITTVVTPADSYDLTDVATFKDQIGLKNNDSDSYLKRLVTAASAAAAQYCNRVFVVETVKDQFWAQRDARMIRGGFSPLQLSRFPVVAIGSLTEDDVALVENTDFIIDGPSGQVTRLDSNGNPRSWANVAITVQYDAGYDPLPADLVDAVLRMMGARYFARKRDPMLRSELIPGVREATWWIATGEQAGNMTPDVIDILDNYRVPIIR